LLLDNYFAKLRLVGKTVRWAWINTLAVKDWLSYAWYEANFWAYGSGLGLGFSIRTEGMKNVPKEGPALLIANHQSFFDPALVGVAARRHLCYLARKTLFRIPAFASYIRSVNAVPVDHEGIGVEGMKAVLQQLQAGRAVVVFPEGTRTSDGALQPIRPGVVLLIKRAKAPVVPVGIAGAFEAWPRCRPLPMPAPLFLPATKGTLAVSIGRPLDGGKLAQLPREQLLTTLFAELTRVHERAQRLKRVGDC
jgi:1-acyl-sn-glycerol-3-phosphate acyltransferase